MAMGRIFLGKKRVGGKKRRRRRRRQNNRQWVSSVTSLSRPSPLPLTFKAFHRYCEMYIDLNPGTGGTPAFYHFSLNSLYDPNSTGVGHQPLGFDEFANMYDHYTVIGSRIKVMPVNLDSTNSQNIALRMVDKTTGTPDMTNIIEQGAGVWTTLGQDGVQTETRPLCLKCNPSKFFGKNVLGDDRYQGGITSSPADQVFAQIAVQPVSATDTSQVRCTVEIEYVAIWSELKTLTTS